MNSIFSKGLIIPISLVHPFLFIVLKFNDQFKNLVQDLMLYNFFNIIISIYSFVIQWLCKHIFYFNNFRLNKDNLICSIKYQLFVFYFFNKAFLFVSFIVFNFFLL